MPLDLSTINLYGEYVEQTSSRPDTRTLIAFISVVILLGVNFVAVRFSNFELDPFWGATLRFGTGTLILLLIMRLKHLGFPQGQALRASLVYGLLSFGVSYALVYWALLYVPSGMTAVLFATLPLMTLVLASLIGLERLTWRNILGGIVAIAGISIIFSQQLQRAVPIIPILAVLLAVLVNAIASVLVKRMEKPHPVTLNAVGMGVGTLFLLVTSLVARETMHLPQLPATWLALGWLTMSALVAFILFVWIVARWTASAATYALVLAPLVTIVLGFWLVNEPITRNFLIGSVIVLTGVYAGTTHSEPKA